MIYPRKEAKSYGTGAEIEGGFAAGERAVVIDDLATTGGSKFEAIGKLSAAGLKIEDVVVLIDRGSGAAEALAAAGYKLHAVMTLAQMLDHWAQSGSGSRRADRRGAGIPGTLNVEVERTVDVRRQKRDKSHDSRSLLVRDHQSNRGS